MIRLQLPLNFTRPVELEQTYQDVNRISASRKENNDCTVIAVAIATGQPYEKVHRLMAKAGRKKGRGTHEFIWAKVLRDLGYEMLQVTYKGKTAKTFAREHASDKRTMLIQMTRHLAAFRNGKLEDWSAGRRKRIQRVYEVRRKNDA